MADAEDHGPGAWFGASTVAATGAGAGHTRSAEDGPGFLHVTTRGGSARVRVDGQRYGFTPLVLKVEAGRHVVTVEGAGDAFLPLQLTVDVSPADTTAAVFTAPSFTRPRPAAAPTDSASTPD